VRNVLIWRLVQMGKCTAMTQLTGTCETNTEGQQVDHARRHRALGKSFKRILVLEAQTPQIHASCIFGSSGDSDNFFYWETRHLRNDMTPQGAATADAVVWPNMCWNSRCCYIGNKDVS
jgi:hypothetical protein